MVIAMSCQVHTLLGQHLKVLKLYSTSISSLVHIMPFALTFRSQHKKRTPRPSVNKNAIFYDTKKFNNFANNKY